MALTVVVLLHTTQLESSYSGSISGIVSCDFHVVSLGSEMVIDSVPGMVAVRLP